MTSALLARRELPFSAGASPLEDVVDLLAGKSLVVLNTSSETLELLKTWFEGHGMRVHTATVTEFRKEGRELAPFIEAAAPDAVIFDVALPYAANWRYLQAQRTDGALKGVPVVVTTPNAGALRTVANVFEPDVAHEIIGKPTDMQDLTAKVTKQLALRV